MRFFFPTKRRIPPVASKATPPTRSIGPEEEEESSTFDEKNSRAAPAASKSTERISEEILVDFFISGCAAENTVSAAETVWFILIRFYFLSILIRYNNSRQTDTPRLPARNRPPVKAVTKNKPLNQDTSHPEDIMLAGIVPVLGTGGVVNEGATISEVIHADHEIPQ